MGIQSARLAAIEVRRGSASGRLVGGRSTLKWLMARTDFIRVDHTQQHITRRRQILQVHPEVRRLAGPVAVTGAWVVALVATQLALALWVGSRSAWIWFPVAYLCGATIDHGLWVLIHECTHNLVFKRASLNRVSAIVANLPLVLPAAQAFRHYHMLHHVHLGEMDFDPDLPGPRESRLIRTAFAKVAWLAVFGAVQGVVRPHRLKIVFRDGWIGANIIVQLLVMAGMWWAGGFGAIRYLALSSVCAIGLHPLGARWIQEHYVFAEGQETYSYYGPLNRVAFNIGYHNEHHDFAMVPWTRLPALKAMAPEFYDTLYAHRSWTRLLFTFLFGREHSLFDRVVRPSR